MGEQEKANLRISGSGSAGGGTYGSVEISGSGSVSGDIICDSMRVSGSGQFSGNIKAGNCRISGSGRIKGDLEAEQLKVSGSLKSEGAFRGGELQTSGSSSFDKGIEVQKVETEGSMRTLADCNAESFVSKGSFIIGGLLNAEDIDIQLAGGKSRAREIGGGKISVREGWHGIFNGLLTLGLYHPILEADLIEGDEINLVNTKAGVVRGNNVTVGSGCEIGLIEYKGELHREGDAKVGQEKQI